MDRTDGHTDWLIVKPFVAETSNCILPANVVREILMTYPGPAVFETGLDGACDTAYLGNISTFTTNPGPDRAIFAAVGFDPSTAPNNGEGFSKDLSGNKLPNSPPFTLSFGTQYTMPPLSEDWAGTLRGDFYWQGNSYARIFNDRPYDQASRLHQFEPDAHLHAIRMAGTAMGYVVKNVFNTHCHHGRVLKLR